MDKNRNKKFLKLPTLGGKKGIIKDIVMENLIYPKAAIDNNIEGDVILSYKVNNTGDVVECKVIKGIGFGCDEEAIRLVKMLKYEEVHNRGVKVTTNNKIKIPFRLNNDKGVSLNITYTESPIDNVEEKDKQGNTSYNYTISI
ncbi:MAG: energy transducer TonB [Bacteroidetes bacterium]|nr:energy transducer TonB [Bacteroidota bacterium]